MAWAGCVRAAAWRVMSRSASKPRRHASRRPRLKSSARPRGSSRESMPQRLSWRRASGSRRSGRCRCSTRRNPANCRRCNCWTIRRSARPAIRPKRSRPCRAWSSSSSRISASTSKWSRCSRARWSRASRCVRLPASRSARSPASRRTWRVRCPPSACAWWKSFPASRSWAWRFPTRSARSSRWAKSSSPSLTTKWPRRWPWRWARTLAARR